VRDRTAEILRSWAKLFVGAAGAAGAAALAGAVAFGLVSAPQIWAQSTQTANVQLPSFEVASIKPNNSGGQAQGLRVQPGGRVTAFDMPLRFLIAPAYRLTPAQIRLISGAPAWIDTERFDLDARGQGNFSEDQLVLMLQALLADRFKLVAHLETRQLPVYALVPAKAGKIGPQITPHTDDAKCVQDPSGGGEPVGPNSVIPRAPCGGIRFLNVGGRMGVGASTTMEIFAANLSAAVDRPVVDRTGLNGQFDLTLEYTPELRQPASESGADATVSDSSAAPSIFTALREQLGLKLESQTGPVDVLVIDHVERPSEN
jgi:uncharacterized protein (TIGR03435 family)